MRGDVRREAPEVLLCLLPTSSCLCPPPGVGLLPTPGCCNVRLPGACCQHPAVVWCPAPGGLLPTPGCCVVVRLPGACCQHPAVVWCPAPGGLLPTPGCCVVSGSRGPVANTRLLLCPARLHSTLIWSDSASSWLVLSYGDHHNCFSGMNNMPNDHSVLFNVLVFATYKRSRLLP